MEQLQHVGHAPDRPTMRDGIEWNPLQRNEHLPRLAAHHTCSRSIAREEAGV
jgi:hypothetical protein